jgi:hypothetical protein
VDFNVTDWLFNQAPIWLLAIGLFLVLLAASAIGGRRSPVGVPGKEDRSQEGYLVTAVLGLLALRLGVTFSPLRPSRPPFLIAPGAHRPGSRTGAGDEA